MSIQLRGDSDALIVTDIQPTFCEADKGVPGSGELPVPGGAEVIPVVNRLMPHFDFVVATRDHHPPDHLSFASRYPGKAPFDTLTLEEVRGWKGRSVTFRKEKVQLERYLARVKSQILWPDHARMGTPGSELHPALDRRHIDEVVCKGEDRSFDSYSAFFDNGHFQKTGLDSLLQARGIDRVFITGLALDFCCYYTALDARGLDYDVVFLEDACRAIDNPPGSRQEALEHMRREGVVVSTTAEIGLD